MFTTPAIVAPALPSLGISPEIATLATIAGALGVVHVNDSFFWVVTRFAGMDVSEGYRSLTTLTLLQGLTALLMVWSLSWKGFPFIAILASSIVFALYHLLFSLQMGKRGMSLIMDVLLPFASSWVFCLAYLLSSNLWLAAFLHGVTNYPLSPSIKSSPFLGLLFMGIAVLLGRYFNSRVRLPLEA